jgi:hypothetical protein
MVRQLGGLRTRALVAVIFATAIFAVTEVRGFGENSCCGYRYPSGDCAYDQDPWTGCVGDGNCKNPSFPKCCEAGLPACDLIEE